MNKVIILFLSLYLFTACSPGPSKQDNEKPYWLKSQNSLDSFYAVGSASVNFQGMYMQRNEAVNKAKAELAHSIESYITSKYKNSSNVSTNHKSFKSIEKIQALSKAFLHNSYQVDAYLDEDRILYVLVKNPKTKQKLNLRPLKKEKYDNTDLIQSRCYSKDVLKSIKTKYPLHNSKPIWFYRPNENSKLATIGIAEKEEYVSFAQQQRVAYSLAKSALSKRQRTQMRSEDAILSVLSGEMSGSTFESSSIVKSATRVKPSHIEDIWMNPKSCELYLYLVANN